MTCCVLLKLEYKNILSDMILKSKDFKKNPKISDFFLQVFALKWQTLYFSNKIMVFKRLPDYNIFHNKNLLKCFLSIEQIFYLIAPCFSPTK